MHLLQYVFLCHGNTPWAPPWSWPFAGSSTFSFSWFLAPRVLYNPVFHVQRIFHNPVFCVDQILHNSDIRVSNTTGTSFFILCVANPVNPVNPSNLIYSSIHATIWANPGSLAIPICLLVRVSLLANPVNLAWVMMFRLANLVNPTMDT
jgi:hypothetical protein